MPSQPLHTPPKTSIKLKLGGWLEAYATGWGVAAIPVVVALVLAAAAARYWLG